MRDPRTTRAARPRAGRILTAGLLLGLVPLAALLAGGVTPHGTQPPTTYPILGPVDGCMSCHGLFVPDRPIEPYDAWAGSMMANAARDPLFWAALDVANHDVPGVGDFCLRCHVPTGWYAGRSEPPLGSVDGCGLLGAIDEPDTDFEGVSCHLCHRVMENTAPPPGELGFYTENAELWLDDALCADNPGGLPGPCRRGPYAYEPGDPYAPPHPYATSPLHREGRFCGACHNVTSPAKTLIDENGVDTGIPYPIERTHAEWSQSRFGPTGSSPRRCQQCHMPTPPDTSGIYACVYQDTDRAGDYGVHEFAGGNTWVPAVLQAEYPNLNRGQAFSDTIAAAEARLESAALLTLTAPETTPSGQSFQASVRVTNRSGHKLPTGYTEGRRMWLQVRALDAGGVVRWQSGAYDAATGVLTEDAQIKVYRAEPGIWNRNGTGECDVADGGGNPIFHFALNDCIRLDNRIPPREFTGGADPEVRPVGYVYPETAPGSGMLVHWDDTDYQITLPAGLPQPVTIEARLLYQTVSKEYVEFLRDQAVANGFPDDCIPRSSGIPMATSRGQYLYDVWTTYGRAAPHLMVSAAAVVAVDGIFLDGFESGDSSRWSSTVP